MKGNWVTIAGTLNAKGGAGGAGGDGGYATNSCNHMGGNGGAGGGAGRIKIVAVNLTENTPTYTLTGGAGGAGGCGGSANPGAAGAAGGSGTVAYVTPGSDISQTYSGTAYDTSNNPIASVNVRFVINGRSANKATTNAAGAWSTYEQTNPGDSILVYLTGAAQKGVTASVAAGANIAGLDLHQSEVLVRNDNSGTTANSNLNTAKGGLTDADIIYSSDASNNITVNSGYNLDVRGNYSPGANLTTQGTGGMLVTSGILSSSTNTVNFGSGGLTVLSGATLSIGSTGTPTWTSTSPPTQYPVIVKGTLNLSSLSLNYAQGLQLGTYSGYTGITGSADADTYSATVNTFNDISFVSCGKGILARNLANVTTPSIPITIRGPSFDASVSYNIGEDLGSAAPNWPYYVTVENSSGAKAGETYESNDPGGNPGDVIWVNFNWKWLGTTSNAWNLAANWLWEGSGGAPESYPGATGPLNNPNSDAIASQRSLWIPSASNPCVEDQSYNILNMDITSGGSLTGGGAQTLSIYGTAFKSNGGSYTASSGNTVQFAGNANQVVIFIGASGSFYNLTINKAAGTTATLGANLTISNVTTVSAGTFETSSYTLTAQGALTIVAGATLSLTGTGGVTASATNAGALTNNGTITMSSSATLDWSQGTGVVTHASGSTFTMASSSVFVYGAGVNTCQATTSLSDTCTIEVPDAGTINTTGGTLTASGTGPTITKKPTGAGGFTFTVTGPTTLNISKLNFSYAGLNGFTIDDSASTVTVTALNNVAFANVVGTPGVTAPGQRRRHLYFKGTANNGNLTLSGCSFDNTFLNGGTNPGYNIVTEWTPNTVVLTISQWSGTGAGGTPDNDYDQSESASLAQVKWNRTLNWQGKEQYKWPVTITTTTSSLPNGYTVTTAAFNTTGKALASGDDVRVVWTNAGTSTEIDRVVSGAGGASTTVTFRVQEAAGIPTSTSNTAYTIYSGASAADAAGPPANKANVYAYWSDFETDNGGFTTALVQGGVASTWTWGTPAGAKPADFSGTKCWATNLNGNYNNGENSAMVSSPAINLTGTSGCTVTLEAWWSINDLSAGKYYDGFDYEQYNGASWAQVAPVPAYDGTVRAGSGSYLQGQSANVKAPAAWTATTLTSTLTNANWQFRIIIADDGVSYLAPGVCIDLVQVTKNVTTAPTVSVGASSSITSAWTEPYNWQVNGTTNQYAAPTATDDVVINGGTYQPSITSSVSCFSVLIGSSATSTLSVATANMTLTTAGPVSVQGSGTLSLGAATTLKMASNQLLSVSSGGALSTSGTTTSARATISASSGSFGLTLAGTMNVSWLTISNLNSSGVVVQSTATLTGWTGVTFSSGAAGGLYLDLSGANSATTLPSTMSQCTFNAGPTNNVKGAGTGATHSKVTFLDWAGALGGRTNTTNDPLDLIVWQSGGSGVAVVNVTQSKTYTTIYDALAATNSGDLVEVRDNVVRSESIDINNLANKVFTLDGAVLQAPSGTFAMKGTGVATNEILQNCVFISNGAAVIQNVGRMYHCDVLGTDATLVTVGAGTTTTIQNCIVGNATSWNGAHNPVSNSGTFNGTYCDFDASLAGAPYNGTGNVNGSPSFVNYAPSNGMYDVHLNTGSPCIDSAVAAPGPVTTTFDRASDVNNDANNQRRPLYPTAGAPAKPYDMGAEEYAPYLAGATPYGVPYWKKQTGPSAGSTPGAASDVVPCLDFANFVFFTGNNVNTAASAAGNQDLLALYMGDGTGAGGTTRATFTTGAQYSKARKIVHITVTRDAGAATDSVYCVVNTDNVGSDGDGIIALTYNGTSFSVKSGWSTTTPALMTTGSGTMGGAVVDGNGDLFVVKGRLLYHLSGASGAAYSTATTPNYWATDGHNNWYTIAGGGNTDAIYDANGGMVADRVNNIVQVPLMGHPTDQIWRINRDSGVPSNNKDTGTQAGYRKNHTGFNEIGGQVYLTPTQTDFVVALTATNLNPNAGWVSGPNTGDSVDLGAQVTTRAATLTRNDADVRVAAGNHIYKLLKSNGTLASDSAAGTDWGNSRSLRGNVTTTPFIVGSKSLAGVAGADTTDDRGSKMFFGTDQGDCYVLSYIRNITGNGAGDIIGDSQPTWSTDTSTYLALDGRPYPGYPYRLPGVKVVQVTQGYSTSISRNLIVFVCDNGWIYAFPEPY